MDNNVKDVKDLLADVCSVEQFSERYPHLGFNRERFNYLLRNKEANGLLESGVLVKDGKAYKVKASEFSLWYYRYINIYGRARG